MQEVASLQVAIPDARLEHERVVARADRADLAHVVEVLEDAHDTCQDRGDGSTAVVGLEHDRAPEYDILGEQRQGAGQIPGFDRGAKWVHGLTSGETGDRWRLAMSAQDPARRCGARVPRPGPRCRRRWLRRRAACGRLLVLPPRLDQALVGQPDQDRITTCPTAARSVWRSGSRATTARGRPQTRPAPIGSGARTGRDQQRHELDRIVVRPAEAYQGAGCFLLLPETHAQGTGSATRSASRRWMFRQVGRL